MLKTEYITNYPTRSQLLQHIQNSLARAVVKAPKFSHTTPILKSLHWLKVNEHIEYKILCLTYKTLSTLNLLILITLSLFSLLAALVRHLSPPSYHPSLSLSSIPDLKHTYSTSDKSFPP